MADARNTEQVDSIAAPSGAVDDDVESLGFYVYESGDNPAGALLGGGDIGNDPNALVLGEKYRHAVGSLKIRMPVAAGGNLLRITSDGTTGDAITVNGDVAATTSNTTSDIVLSSSEGLVVNQHITIDSVSGYRAYKITAVNSNGTTITVDGNIIFAITNGTNVKIALETEETAKRKLKGLIDSTDGVHVAYFNSSWAATKSGTTNQISELGRTQISAWEYI